MSAKIKEIQALRDAALEDLMSVPDADLSLEAKDSEVDLDTLAKEMKATMRETAADALRQRMLRARTKSLAPATPAPLSKLRPSIEAIKEMIQSLIARDPTIGMAFRDGKRQSDSDWLSLYDDLVDLGAIKHGDDEH
jgi:hypothetical protein